MHIAVTGGTGFVGQHLIKALRRENFQISALTRRELPAESEHINWIAGDLDDPASLDALVGDVDAVVHLAGLTKALTRTQFFDVNQHGVRAVRSAALKNSKRPHFILVSTLAASLPRISAYAGSKAAGEAVFTDNDSDLPWTIVRPPVVYGPGDAEFLKIVKAVNLGIAPNAAPKGSRVSMIHVADLVNALMAVIRTGGPTGSIVEPDDGAPNGYTIEEIINSVSSLLERKPLHLKLPKAVLYGIGAVNQAFAHLSRRPAILTLGKAKELSRGDWLCHDQALIRSTGWAPEISFDVGLAETIKWYKSEELLR